MTGFEPLELEATALPTEPQPLPNALDFYPIDVDTRSLMQCHKSRT